MKKRILVCIALLCAGAMHAFDPTNTNLQYISEKEETLTRQVDTSLRNLRRLYYLCDADRDWNNLPSNACKQHDKLKKMLERMIARLELLREKKKSSALRLFIEK